ncbi:MAG: glycosyltransferase [Sulfurovaceae bacterium]|nr:glycosyltransferase [Sulfurovaceae bacterium]
MKKQRIVFIIHALYSGGAQRVVVNLVNNLNRDKFDIHLIVLKAEGIMLGDIASDVTIHDLNNPSISRVFFKFLKKIYSLKPHIVFSGIGHINGLLSPFIPILNRLIPHNVYWVARETSIASLYIQHDSNSHLYQFLYRKFYKNFNQVICQSSYMRDDLIKAFNLPKEKMVVINNPVDIDKIERLSMEKMSREFNPDVTNILAVGALREEKRFDLLLEAFALLGDNYSLTIVGEGEKEQELKALSSELNIEKSVFFEGQQSNPYNYMKNADVLVLTSAFEGFPNVLLESNSCGTSVIAFNAPGGIAEIVQEGFNGHLVPFGSVEKMARTILSFNKKIFNETKIKEHIKNKYALNSIIEKYEKVLLRCMK